MKTGFQPNYIKGIRSSLIWAAVDYIFPAFCCNCGVLGHEICPSCWEEIVILHKNEICTICGDISPKNSVCTSCMSNDKPAFSQMRSWGIYTGVLQKSIQRLKFERGLGLVPYFAPVCADFISSWNISVDLIIPVPLGRKRKAERGYNQSELIAKRISNTLRIPYSSKSLKRIKNTKTQVGLNAIERAVNVRDAFYGSPELLKEKSVLIIDDITTTGSTINECSRAVMNAGAKCVFCFTIARTPLQSEELNKRRLDG